MATYKEEAVVLRAFDLGEADRIISLITAGRGLRRGVAKGVRRTKSKFGARLEPFTRLEAILYEGRNLDTITQVEILDSHAPLREDYNKYVYGEAMLETIEKSLQEEQCIPRIYEALCISLGVLEREVVNPALLLAAFEFKICALIGYHPHLEECLRCGRAVGEKGATIDLVEGGVVCSKCSRPSSDTIKLSRASLALIRDLIGADMATISGWAKDPRLCREVLDASLRFTQNYLERPLKSGQMILRQLDQKISLNPR